MVELTKRIFLSPPHMGGQELEFVKQAFAGNYIKAGIRQRKGFFHMVSYHVQIQNKQFPQLRN
jgi:imidazoleglycerol phosphate synthase glutamine amidotransferase subunit HisH